MIRVGLALLILSGTAHASVRYELDVTTRQSPPAPIWATIDIDDAPSPCELVFANWLPGAYELRWFGRDVAQMSATASGPLTVERVSPSRFVVRGHAAGAHLRVRYRVTASLMSDDGAEISAAHVYINPAAVVPRVIGRESTQHTLALRGVPAAWHRVSSLSRSNDVFAAPSFYALADSLVEAAPAETLAVETRTISGGEVTFAVDEETAQRPPAIDAQLIEDVTKLIDAEIALAGPLPWSRYLLLIHRTDRPGHAVALEHAAATSVLIPTVSDADALADLRRMLAHELFHAWNARRIVPKELITWDPERPQSSRDLWISEGLTEYAAMVAEVRAGLLDAHGLSSALAEHLTRARRAEMGLSLEALSQLAFAAPRALAADEDAYYAVGAVVSLALVADVLKKSHGSLGLADIIKALLPAADAPPRAVDRYVLAQVLESLAPSMTTTYDDLVTHPFSFRVLMKHLPLTLSLGTAQSDAGLLAEGTPPIVQLAEAGGAWARAGVESGDTIVSLDGEPATTQTIAALDEMAPHRHRITATRAGTPLSLVLEPRRVAGAVRVDEHALDLKAPLFRGPR